MKITLTQKKMSAHYQFNININEEEKYCAKANRTIWPFFRILEINTIANQLVLKLQQKNHWLKFIEPKWLYGCPFKILENGKDVGWIRSWFRIGQPTAIAEIKR